MPIQAPQWTEYLTCPICYNEFEDKIRQPVSLGCGHTLCKSCLAQLHRTQCPFDQASVNTDTSELPVNTALLQLVGADISSTKLPNIQCVKDNAAEYLESKRYIEELALFMKPLTSSGSNENLKMSNGAVSSNGNVLTRPMQRKLVTLVNCQLAEEEGRIKAMRAARSLGERTVTELILLHQNQQQLSGNLWAAVRARGCQFLGPAMQEEALHFILLALEGGEALSRKVLVLFVVQRLETNFPQASKTSIGHVVQLLYRASCFKVTKRDDDSSLMQLKENFRTLDALRKEHDAQIVHIAMEAGLRISPDQWSSLLYGDLEHKSHMQSIIDKLQSPASFAASIQELIIALQRSGDPGQLTQLRNDFELLSKVDASPEATNPSWQELQEGMRSVHAVVHGLVEFQRTYGNRMKGSSEPQPAHNSKFKTSLCRDFQRGNCPRGNSCTFAHSDDEVKRYGRKRETIKPVIPRGTPSGVGAEQYSPGVSNGSVEGPPLTEGGGQSTNCNGTSRSSPLCVPTQGIEMSNGYRTHVQHPVPMRQPVDMVSQMSKLSIRNPQPVYPEPPSPGYVTPQGHAPYERMPYSPTVPPNDRYFYYGQSPPVTMATAGSYSTVAARGTEMKPGMLASPRVSPQTVQDENLNGSRESPVANGHIDPAALRRRGFQTEMQCRRRELGPLIQQPPQSPAGYHYHSPYNPIYAPYDVHCRNSAEIIHSPYNGGRYETGPQGAVVAGYMAPYDYYNGMQHYYPAFVTERMVSRKPYIPDESKLSDCSKRTSQEATDGLGKLESDHGPLGITDILSDYKPYRKDTGPSSSSSGVSSASPLSHSPAASHSSGSSLSPGGSPVTWQSGSDGDLILRSLYSSGSDSNNLPPPPPTIWSSSQTNGTGWPSNLGLLIPAYHSDRDKQSHLSETDMRDLSEVEGPVEPPSVQNDMAIARTLQTYYDEELAEKNGLERRESQERAKKEQEKTDLEVATSIQRLEENEEITRQKKREEYQRLLRDRKMLLEKQKRDQQELLDRKLAERIAFEDAQQAGLVRPEPLRRPMPIGYNPDVISRGLPASTYCHHSSPDDFGSNSTPNINGFSSFTGFHSGCGSSLGKDDDMDGPKLASGSSGDIRVQE